MSKTSKPRLVIGNVSYERLQALASAAMRSSPDPASELLEELARARIVAEDKIPDSVVRIGSTVAFRDNRRDAVRTVRLVYPYQADIADRRISVLTPIGVALIGLSVGQTMRWCDRDGAQRELTVLSVTAEEAAPAI